MVDVLGQAEESVIVDRAKKLEKEKGLSTDAALEKAAEEISAERAEKNLAATQAWDDTIEAQAESLMRGRVESQSSRA